MQVARELVYSRNSHTHKKSTAMLRSIGTPYSMALVRALQSGDYDKIVNADLRPSDYDDSDKFALDYLAYSLLRKYSLFPLGLDTANLAIEKFLESEDLCRLTNITNVMPYRPATCGRSPESYISYARNIISRTLGDFSWDEVSDRFAFSGGASTRLKRKSGAPFYKFQGKPDTTRNNALLAICAIQDVPLWRAHMASEYGENPHHWVNIVEGSRITTVAKTAKIDRCIAIEPDMNMYVQKGIGSVIRSRLKSVHIDLNDQTHNQKLAAIGSGTGSLVTIDLASASDSIALKLVELLLPSDWFEAMCLCRSEAGILPNGVKHRFEKISSMGNGFTFELESLIFWALAKSVLSLNGVSDRRLGIYGDDIVIHNSAAEDLISLLDYCGFKTNIEKTFLTGPFRESCGKHYFYGKDVTPFYIKTPLDSLARLFWFTNSVRLWASNRSKPSQFQSVYSYLIDSIPRKNRYYVPMSLGSEAGIWASFDECSPVYRKWKQAYSLKRLSARRRSFAPNGVAALLHYFNGRGEGELPDVLRLCDGERGPTRVLLEKGETSYFHSRSYVSWWDVAPCGVTIN